ncbi:MAG: GGDEF domain-containing protein [Nocardioidaceae bacterium]|nr:GGDEF domain-containing protein [Nocardioidaceae bacterium]
MTPQARSGVSAAAMGSEDSAAEARLAAFRLTEAVQIRETGDELADRLAEAVSQGWHDVVRLLLYADAVVAWTAGDPRLEETLERLRDRAQREGDDVGVATALSMLAEVRSTTESARIREESDHDLARATALLAVAEGGALERARAFMSCAAAYQRRELWELEEEMYERASALLPDCEEPLLDRVVLVNLTGSQALHACALREVGELEQAGTRLTPGLEAAEAALRVDMPDTYQVDVRIFRHLLVAVVGAVEVEPAAALTGSIETAGNPWPEAWYGSLSLAEAVRAADRGDWAEAARLASDALARLGETSSPELGLALRVAAEADAALGAPGAGHGLRWAQHSAQRRWASRMRLLGSARARLLTEQLRVERDLHETYANVDELTGVANRRGYARHLDVLRAGRGARRLGVLMVDVDSFKGVNDSRGHRVGDEVLRRVATALTRATRPTDLVARVGGDEFVVVVADADADAAHRLATRFATALNEETWDDLSTGLAVTVSVGVSAGVAGDDLERLVESADQALYVAKARGSGQVHSC